MIYTIEDFADAAEVRAKLKMYEDAVELCGKFEELDDSLFHYQEIRDELRNILAEFDALVPRQNSRC